MPSTRLAPRALLVLLAAISLACDDPLRPADVAGTYVLRTVRGEPLPALLWQGDRAEMRIFADTVVLNADGTGREVSHLQFSDPSRTIRARSELPLSFEVHDDRLEGAYLCPPGATCLAVIQPLRGEFTAFGLRIDVGKHSGGPLWFERPRR